MDTRPLGGIWNAALQNVAFARTSSVAKQNRRGQVTKGEKRETGDKKLESTESTEAWCCGAGRTRSSFKRVSQRFDETEALIRAAARHVHTSSQQHLLLLLFTLPGPRARLTPLPSSYIVQAQLLFSRPIHPWFPRGRRPNACRCARCSRSMIQDDLRAA